MNLRVNICVSCDRQLYHGMRTLEELGVAKVKHIHMVRYGSLSKADAEYLFNYDEKPNGVRLSSVIKKLPVGRYVLTMRNHALALIDGKIIDHRNRGVNTKVEAIWRVE